MCSKLEEVPTDNVIIAGYFNFVANRLRDSNYTRENNTGAKKAFSKIIKRYDVIDTWRELNPHNPGYTWTRQNPLKYSRLDRIYIQDHLTNYLLSASVHAGYRSDHNIVSLTIKEPQMKRGPGLWKFNASLLEDKTYDELVR